MEPVAKQGAFDLSGIDDDRFLPRGPRVRIIEALRTFAETATGGCKCAPGGLFAGDGRSKASR